MTCYSSLPERSLTPQGSAAGAKPPLTCAWATEYQTAAVPPVRLQPVVRRLFQRLARVPEPSLLSPVVPQADLSLFPAHRVLGD